MNLAAKTFSSKSHENQDIKPDWGIIGWLVFVHLAAIPAFWNFSWSAVAVGGVLYFLTGCVGITFGYHRWLSHRSLHVNKWFGRFATLCGTLSLQGTALEWVAHHRMHHAFSDQPGDPHNARRGFWFSHIGWLFFVDPKVDAPEVLRRYGRDILRDPWLAFMSRIPVMIGLQIILGLALLAIGGWSWVFWGIFLRAVCVYHTTWLVNSATHRWGYRNFDDVDDLARNNWWVALFTWGEGWHNNHHKEANVCRAGYRWWEIDITYGLIKMLHWLGLVSDLKLPQKMHLLKEKKSDQGTPSETVQTEPPTQFDRCEA